MAEVSYLHLQDVEDDEDNAPDDVVVTLHSAPFCSPDFDGFDFYTSDPDFARSDLCLRSQLPTVRGHNSGRTRVLEYYSETAPIINADLFDRENQVNFVMDLFHQRVEQSSIGDAYLLSQDPNLDPSLDDFERNDEMSLSPLELDLGLGLGLCLDRHGLADETDDHDCGFMVAERGNEFCISSRGPLSEYGESSPECSGGGISGLRVVGIGSDSEEEDNDIVGIDVNVVSDYGLDNNGDDDASLRLCWDSFQLEDHRDANEDFEWEEVDGRVDEREVLSVFIDADVDEDLDASVQAITPSQEVGMERVGAMGNLDWEVLLNVRNLESNVDLEHDGEPYLGDYEEYNADEYEMLFGQFAANENAMVGKPPASKAIVENLPSVVLTQHDVDNNNALCAVCKDEIVIGGQAKQLPCSHRYHSDCIIPWLGIRNTCPVCRHELPTDDPDYEQRKTQRVGHVH